MSDLKALKDRTDHLQKREAKLTREIARERKRVDHLIAQVENLSEALRRGLPHMNLAPFLPPAPDPGDGELDG